MVYYFYQFDPHCFLFFFLLWKLFLFLISPFNEKFVFIFLHQFWSLFFYCFFFCLFAKLIFLFNLTFQSNIKLLLYFNFHPRSFNCYFFVFNPFYNWNYFFNFILQHLIENWVTLFFQIICFRSKDLDSRFEKLIRFDIFLKKIGFVIFLIFLYRVSLISWSRLWV